MAGRRLDPQTLDGGLRARFRLLGLHGLVGIALAGVEMAAWDACAWARELSLVKLLGGETEKRIAAGASDQVTLDVMKLGGVRGWLTAAARS